MRNLVVTAILAGCSFSFAASLPEAQTLLDKGEWRDAAEMAEGLNTSDGLTLAAEATTRGAGLVAADQRAALFEKAVGLARKGVSLNPNNSNAHFELARANGRLAQYKGILQSLGLAGEVKNALTKAIELNNRNASAYVALGLWNAELASRGLIATAATGARSSDVRPNFDRGVQIEPQSVTHRLEYANGMMKLAASDRRRAAQYKRDAIGILEAAVDLPARNFWEQRDLDAAKKMLADLKK